MNALPPVETIPDVVPFIMQEYGKSTAFAFKSGFRTTIWTYEELQKSTLKTLSFLNKQGIKKGDRIAIYAPNSPWWACVYFACVVSGIVIVPLDFNSRAEFVEKICRLTEAKLLFTNRAAHHFRVKTVSLEDIHLLVNNLPPAPMSRNLTGKSLLEIVFTSGTTGNPKGVLVSQGNIVANISALRQVMPVSEGMTFLSTLPLSHMLEQSLGLLGPLRFGCTIVYLQTKSSSAILEVMQEHSVNAIVTVPIFLKLLKDNIIREVENNGKQKQFYVLLSLAAKLPSQARRLIFQKIHKKLGGKLKFIVVGGAPLDRETELFWENLGVLVLQGYGLTEASPVIACNTITSRKPFSVGKRLPNVSVRLAKRNEILVKGQNITSGYYKNEEATKEAFEKGWFKTGDIGEFDKDGFLFIRSRKKNMMVTSSGQKVYPEDIELILNSISGVEESCVVQLGERIVAAILPKSTNLNTSELLRKVNGLLSEAQKLDEILMWPGEDFPRTVTLKVIRKEVAKRLGSKAIISPQKQVGNNDVLLGILKKISGKEEVSEKSSLVNNLNLSSLDRVELVTLIEESFGIEIDESAITERTTVASLRESLKKSGIQTEKLPFYQWATAPFALFARQMLQPLLFFAIRLFVIIKYEGKENFTKVKYPVIFMSNHTSHLDTPAILLGLPQAIRKKTAVAAAMDYFFDTSGPLKKTYSLFVTLLLNAYPFSRDKTGFVRKSLKHSGKLLDKGFSILVFPEGTRNSTTHTGRFKIGAGLLALQMKVPIIPVKVKGLDSILPKGANFLKFGKATVSFGKPLYFSENDSYLSTAKKIEQAVRKL